MQKKPQKQKKKFVPSQIGNPDEVPVIFELPSFSFFLIVTIVYGLTCHQMWYMCTACLHGTKFLKIGEIKSNKQNLSVSFIPFKVLRKMLENGVGFSSLNHGHVWWTAAIFRGTCFYQYQKKKIMVTNYLAWQGNFNLYLFIY